MERRKFIKSAALGSGAIAVGSTLSFAANNQRKIKVGFIGVGGRGRGLLNTMLSIDWVEVPAICDINPGALATTQEIIKKHGGKKAAEYGKDELDYKKLVERDDLDAVIIATYWQWHTPMAVDAMKAGKYVGVEVPAALSIDECWQLVNTSEETGIPCMMLENWSFRRDNLAVLNMIRAGLFGEIVHSHCAHSHDCIDHWFFDSQTGMDKWPARYLADFNRDQYPTHSVGPVLSWLDINCGDVVTEIYSTATAQKGINAYMARKFGADHPNATRKFNQGDIVTSTLKTANGKTIIINYDMQLPRPYSNRWLLQGTLGVYDEEKNSIYLAGVSPGYHEWEIWSPYEEKYLHKWWKEGSHGAGHVGTDFIMLREFISAVRVKGQTPIDVYDSVVMSAIVELSGISIQKNRPVDFPDFTKGKWRERKPWFGV